MKVAGDLARASQKKKKSGITFLTKKRSFLADPIYRIVVEGRRKQEQESQVGAHAHQ